MTGKIDLAIPRIVQFLLLALSQGTTEGERATAFDMLRRTLEKVDPGGHELAERIKASSALSEEEMKQIFDAGRAQGRADEALEQQHRAVTPAPKPFFRTNGFGNVSQSACYGFDDRDRIAGSDIYNGYQWSDIAEYCATNLNRIPAKHHGFIKGMASKLAGSTISGKQAKYLGNLFNRYLHGRI